MFLSLPLADLPLPEAGAASNPLRKCRQGAMYGHIEQKLKHAEIIILDGGTGTDIQNRGAPMSGETWCAEVNLTHPDIVRAVHDDYIAVGADVITANTFATSALLFNALGRDDDLIAIDRAAVSIAKEAAKDKPVAVAGSMSTMRPVQSGSDRTDLTQQWPEAEARRLFRRKAENLAASGVDLIMMEMMRDGDYALWASEAAMETGLPVWIGISAERGEDGALTGFGRPDRLLNDFAPRLAALTPAVITIMHTSPNDTGEALEVVRKSWQGPLGAYPESGYFKMPDWQFVNVISPQDLVIRSQEWRGAGATIFGGCCGIGPEHIKALSKAMRP
jgi:S-methylmethionine-dependent homocysteine/selenocysteine methylase